MGQAAFGLAVKNYRFGIPGDRGVGIGFDSGIRWIIDLGQAELALAAISRDIGWTEIRWTNMGETTIDHAAWVNRIAAAVKKLEHRLPEPVYTRIDHIWSNFSEGLAALRSPRMR